MGPATADATGAADTGDLRHAEGIEAMDLLFAILMLGLGGVVLAPLAAWWVRRGYEGLGSFVNLGDGDWWRATMPWPQGVQEEDGVRWRFRDADPSPGTSARRTERSEPVADAFDVAPTRARAHVGLRHPAPPR